MMIGSALGFGPAMRPPNYWKSVSVENSGASPIVLDVTFGDNETGHHVITETHTLQAGELFTFPEQQYEEGGWTSVARVQHLDAQCVNGSFLSERQTFVPQPTAGVEAAHQVHMSCTAGILGVHM
ncbi:hypothetical protein KFE25_012717 [Diacronema lutheri]|uniref:Uncharacterized protein n=2 Tax=Diacronema lutheri TaxID=2081491 RepID=A0A8J5XC96_DIALT|nr:hypothetical protein KFE25_012717 [Diacronema lutheri]